MNHAKTILPALLGLLVLFWTGDKIGYRIRADMEAGVSGLDMADRFWLDLLDPSHISTHPTDMLCGLTLVAVAGLAWAYRRAARLTLRNGEEHGSAHWAGPRDIKLFIDPDPAHNLRFTRTERLSTDTRRTLRNLNVLLLGSSGSGKTRYYVKPNLLGADMNWAVTDPKGELKRDTESPMKARGYAVHALDLVDLTRSDRFNPMRYIDPAEPQLAILRLTDNLVTNATGDRKNGDGFWEDAEKALLSALIAWVHYTEDEPTLNHVTDMLDQMGASEQDEEREFIVDALFAETRVEIAAMRAHEDDYDEQTRDMLEGLAFACAQYNTFLKGAGETKKSIIITTGVHLAPLQVREVRRILSGDDIHLESLDEGKRVVYLELPDTNATFGFLASVFYQCLFETLVRKADHTDGGRLGRDVHCLLDEFANIGKIPNFVRLVATIRSRGISCSIILQTVSQGKSLYKDDWETIAGNCDSWLFLGGNEASTTKTISDRLGDQTIDVIETSETKGMNGSWSRSVRKNARKLLTPDELGRLDTDQCVYLLRGLPPFLSHKLTD